MKGIYNKPAEELLDLIDSLIVSLDSNGTIIYINKKSCELLRYEKQELIGKNWFDACIPKEKRKEVQAIFNELMKGELKYTEFFENPVVTKKGEEKLISWHNTLLEDSKGKITGTISTGEDITEREKAERELKESEEKYKSLFESSRDAIMTLAPPTWKFTSGNRATVEMFKAKDEKQFISLRPWQLSPKYQPDGAPSDIEAKKMIEIAMKEGSNFFEWTHKRFGGENFSATVLLTRLELKGKKFLQATVRDITREKKAEKELKERAEELEKFNQFAVGRELKMVELKKEVNALLNQQDLPPKYQTD